MGEKRYMHIGALGRLIVHALLNGAQTKSFVTYEWNISGRCSEPVIREIEGREYIDRNIVNPRHPQLLRLTLKCRRCANCRWERQMTWTAKAISEWELSHRTWFVTLTMSPRWQHTCLSRAANRLHKGGTTIERLGVVDRFHEHVSEAGKELTKYFKRLRKNYGAPIRYLVVAEPHKSGLPHYHALIHETSRHKPLLKKHLVAEWQLGFVKAKLVHDVKVCGYVAKYLGKTKAARVRASLGYGEGKVPRKRANAQLPASLASVNNNAPSTEQVPVDDCSS